MALLLARIATVLLGLLAGAMLLIGVAVVPYWRSLEPLEFSQWFAANSAFIGRLMVPLGTLATSSIIVAAVVARAKRAAGWPWLVVAAGFAAFIAAIYPLYYAEANAALGAQSLPSDAVVAELGRWQFWHWCRGAAGLLAFVCALAGASSPTQGSAASREGGA